jgi:hypothetical protein
MVPPALDSFLVAMRDGRDFIPIQVSSLRLDTVTNFDLYIQAFPGEPAVLYADRTFPFTEKSRKRLEDNRIEYLYVSNTQIPEYRRYVEANIEKILIDISIRMEDKSHLLHLTAQGVVQDVLSKTDIKDDLARGHDLVVHIVEFLFGQRESLRHLVECASTE